MSTIPLYTSGVYLILIYVCLSLGLHWTVVFKIEERYIPESMNKTMKYVLHSWIKNFTLSFLIIPALFRLALIFIRIQPDTWPHIFTRPSIARAVLQMPS